MKAYNSVKIFIINIYLYLKSKKLHMPNKLHTCDTYKYLWQKCSRNVSYFTHILQDSDTMIIFMLFYHSAPFKLDVLRRLHRTEFNVTKLESDALLSVLRFASSVSYMWNIWMILYFIAAHTQWSVVMGKHILLAKLELLTKFTIFNSVSTYTDVKNKINYTPERLNTRMSNMSAVKPVTLIVHFKLVVGCGSKNVKI